jgi:hypothetical protein
MRGLGVIVSLHHLSRKSGWFASVLGEKRSRIAHLLGQIAGLGLPGMLKPKKFKKFLELMAQVAEEQDKEHDFIASIEAMEHRHSLRRDANQLERADPAYISQKSLVVENVERYQGLWRTARLWLDPEGQDCR